MRFADVDRATVDLPQVLFGALEQYSDPSDEATANTVSREEVKSVLEGLGMR